MPPPMAPADDTQRAPLFANLARTLTVVVICLGLGVTYLASQSAQHDVQRLAKERFHGRVADAVESTVRRLQHYEAVLLSGAAMVEARGAPTRQQWHDFVAGLRVGQRYPGLQGIGYSLRLAPAEVAAHVRAVRAEGFPEYSIRPAGKRSEFHSIVYLEPFADRNLRAFGYDMFSESVRRSAMERARDSGAAALSGKVTLVQETTEKKQAGVLMYVPVYRRGAPTGSVAERQAALEAFVYAPFRMDDLMHPLRAEEAPAVLMRVYDGASTAPEQLLYDDVASVHNDGRVQASAEPMFRETATVEIAGRVWTLQIDSGPLFEAEVDVGKPLLIAALGFAFSAVLGVATWLLATGRRRAEHLVALKTEELARSEARLRSLNELSSDWYWEQDEHFRFLPIRSTASAELNQRRESIVGKARWEVQGLRLIGETMAEHRAQVEAYRPFRDLLVEHRWPDGGFAYSRVSGEPRFDGNGRFAGYHGTGRDITAQHLAEQALQRKQHELADFIDNAAVGMHLLDAEGRIIWANRAELQLLGYAKDEFIGRHSADLHADPVAGQAMLACIGRGETVEDREIALRAKDGSLRHVLLNASLFREDGRFVHTRCFLRDVTARKLAEEELQRANDKLVGSVEELEWGKIALEEAAVQLRTVIDSVVDAIVMIDEKGIIETFNLAAERIFGYSAREAIGQNVKTLMPPPYSDRHDGYLAQHVATGEQHIIGRGREVIGRRKDGAEFPMDLAVSKSNAGGKRKFIGVIRDVTERKAAEERVRRANEDLTRMVGELEARSQESALLSNMGEILQTCTDSREACAVLPTYLTRLFGGVDVSIYLFDRDRDNLALQVRAGSAVEPTASFLRQECWGLRRGQAHGLGKRGMDISCAHVTEVAVGDYLCLPMAAQGETIGLLHLRFSVGTSDAEKDAAVVVAQRVTSQLALAFRNLDLRETLARQAIRDSLTGLYNRRHLEAALAIEISRAARKQRPIGVIILDLDHFKRLNDTYGHEAGDKALRAFGDFLKTRVRPSDIACRYGGEEFVLVLPESPLDATAVRAETFCREANGLVLNYQGQSIGPITASIGVAAYPEHGTSAAELLRAADAALYEAKRQGRNRVVVRTPVLGSAQAAAVGTAVERAAAVESSPAS